MKKILFFIALFTYGFGYSQGHLHGTVVDADSANPLAFAYVTLYKGEELEIGTSTNEKGNYWFENVEGGTYRLEISYLGYTTQVKNFQLPDAVSQVDYFRLQKGIFLKEVEIYSSETPKQQREGCFFNIKKSCSLRPMKSQEESSESEIANENELIFPKLDVFPNPSNGDQLTLKYQSSNKRLGRRISIEIYDALGKRIYYNTRILSNEQLNLKLNTLSTVKPGHYILKLVDQDSALSKRLLISR